MHLDDCKWNFAEFSAAHTNAMGSDDQILSTNQQVRVGFVWYDTRGCTQAEDGFVVCDDVPYFFDKYDANGGFHYNSTPHNFIYNLPL
jgi:hypothetical protein